MDWIKVKVKHAEYDFAHAPAEVFKSWIMMMIFVAATERHPTQAQLEIRLGKDNYSALVEHMSENGADIDTVIGKVLEDVKHIQSRREDGKLAMRKIRGEHHVNANMLPGETIRDDKIREDTSNDLREFFDYFTLKTKKNLTLTGPRAEIIKSRLKTHSIDQLKRAVDAFVLDTWPDRHKFMDVVYCIGIRNKVDNLDRWLNIPVKKKERGDV